MDEKQTEDPLHISVIPSPGPIWKILNSVISKLFQILKLSGLLWNLGPTIVCLIPNMHPNMHIWHIWPYLAYLGAYLGARNMVKWGVPEKILQNAVQTRWS